MKAILPIILAGMALTFSCVADQKEAGHFNLLPAPQHFELTGNSGLMAAEVVSSFSRDGSQLPFRGEMLGDLRPVEQEADAEVVFWVDGSLDLPAEGYTLEIGRDQVMITGRDHDGLLYGFMTLDQIMEDAAEQQVKLPLCTVRDFPRLSYRAIHLDLKHHRETTDYYYSLMDKLAGYKVNAIIAELEDKLDYERQPGIGSADAFTIEEWKAISDYAMERNIEISPLIQGLGHASFILKHDKYRDVRDDPESDWAFNPLDPETYRIQFDLYLDAMEATPHGRYLHVGGDEVHTTGRGSGKSQLELQLIWLDKVCSFAADHGRIPIFWDDMPLKHASVYMPMFNLSMEEGEVDSIWKANEHMLLEFLDRFPKNCIYMRWNYSTPQTYGNQKAMEWFTDHDLKVMGATAGQTRWVLMPQNESNMENIRSFAMTSIDKGLDGLLLTLWDDDSPHFELYMRGILAFAEYAWSGDLRGKEEIKSAYRHREFSSSLAGEEFSFIDRLEKPVEFWNNALLKEGDRRRLKKMDNAIEEAIIDLPDPDAPGKWITKYGNKLEWAAGMLSECNAVEEIIGRMRSVAVRNVYRLDVYEQVNRLARFAPELLLALKKVDEAGSVQEREKAVDAFLELTGEFQPLREDLEKAYAKTRILNKPDGYLLDQDHHTHLANQTVNFDWLFTSELAFLEKVKRTYQ
jgi:hypothetical protein